MAQINDLVLKGFFDDLMSSLTSAATQVFNQVLLPAVNNQLTNVSLLGAHVLGGLSQESNIIGTLSTLIGKREVKGFFDELIDSLQAQLTSAANQLLSTASLQLAIALAQFSQGGGISPIGKRDMWDDLLNNLTSQLTATANSLLSQLSLSAAIALAQFSQSGGISSVIG